MDPRYRGLEFPLCDVCQRAVLQSICEFCQINLCKSCTRQHLSDSSKKHNVVPYKHKTKPNYPKCPNHVENHCQMNCLDCDIFVCSICISSNKHNGHRLFGSLIPVCFEKPPPCPPIKPLLDKPELIAKICTGYEQTLRSITCLGNEKIYVCGDENVIKLYNLHGKLLWSTTTKSEKNPHDVAVTKSGNLVYTDPDTRTVNIIKENHIQEVIGLQEWIPFHVCCTSSGDLLITLNSDDRKQTKIVRYFGSTEKQSIQFDNQGKPLYSADVVKYISENWNLDICVADRGANAVVVVNQAGKLRFRYTGHPSHDRTSFHPIGITTDSQGLILISNNCMNFIHILDQDEQFLRFIDNCDLLGPWGLCVDNRDNLIVAENRSGIVKEIKYTK